MTRSRNGFRGWMVLLLAAALAGCQSTKPAVKRALVEMADLGVTGASADANTFTRVETQGSIGRFPAGVAVARVMLEVPADVGKGPLVIHRLLDPEALYWNELFDSIPKIREVTVIDPQSVPQRYVTIPQLLEAARRLKCRLCVVYAQNDVADNASQAIGAVYDSDSSELVGVAFAEELVDPKQKVERPADRPDGDTRHIDAHWLGARRFEKLIREFVWQLIQQDREPGGTSEPATQPAAPGPAPVTSAPAGR